MKKQSLFNKTMDRVTSDEQKTDLMLEPIYLTEEEAERRQESYLKQIKIYQPDFKHANKERFEKILTKKNETACKNFMMDYAFDYIIYLYQNFNMYNYPFEDLIADTYLFINDKFNKGFRFNRTYEKFAQLLTEKLNEWLEDKIAKSMLRVTQHLSDEEFDLIYSANTTIAPILKDEIKQQIESLLLYLSEQEKEILELFYGLNGKQSFTIREIAKELDLEDYEVSNIINFCMRKLRNPMRIRVLKDQYFSVD